MKTDLYQHPDYFNMDDLLSEEHKLVRDATRAWVKKEVSPIIDEHYEKATFPMHILGGLGEIGAFGPYIPEEYGGPGLDHISYGLIMQELERCFKDPKAYGDRLARILSVSEAKQEPTVILSNPKSPVQNQTAKWNAEAIKSPIPRPDISGENLPAGSQRRDHLLPPRSVPHFTKKPISPELIAAHLPERRQHQRMAESTRLAKSAAGHAQQQKNIHATPLPQSRPSPQHRQAKPANHHALQRQAPRPAVPVANHTIERGPKFEVAFGHAQDGGTCFTVVIGFTANAHT
jgi:hypothetical protein